MLNASCNCILVTWCTYEHSINNKHDGISPTSSKHWNTGAINSLLLLNWIFFALQTDSSIICIHSKYHLSLIINLTMLASMQNVINMCNCGSSRPPGGAVVALWALALRSHGMFHCYCECVMKFKIYLLMFCRFYQSQQHGLLQQHQPSVLQLHIFAVMFFRSETFLHQLLLSQVRHPGESQVHHVSGSDLWPPNAKHFPPFIHTPDTTAAVSTLHILHPFFPIKPFNYWAYCVSLHVWLHTDYRVKHFAALHVWLDPSAEHRG